jgi:hypothetical protein
MNVLAKFLVVVHVILSLAGMSWALMLFVYPRDLAWLEPAQEVYEYDASGKPSTKPGATARFASEYDKSVVAVQEAGIARDRAYQYVKPALESIANTEKYLPDNHLYYCEELARLRRERTDAEKKDEKGFKVFRLKDAGHALRPEDKELGRPEKMLDEVAMIKKPYDEYKADLDAIFKQLDAQEKKIREIADKTEKITTDLTGTSEIGKVVNPGLYALNDMEFKFQKQLQTEIDDIKPFWSKALEQANSHRLRRMNLEETLKKLQEPPSVNKKKL